MLKDMEVRRTIRENKGATLMLMYNDRRWDFHKRTCACFIADEFIPEQQPFFFENIEVKPSIDYCDGTIIILQESDTTRDQNIAW